MPTIPIPPRPCSRCSAADKLSYKPTLVGGNVEGRMTGSTFVLEQPRCVFDNYSTANIWLVVATRAGEWGDGGMGLYRSAPLHRHPHPCRHGCFQ